MRGVQALLDPEVCDQLKLTEQQVADIRAALVRRNRPLSGATSTSRERGDSRRGFVFSKPESDGKQGNEQALRVLTPEQRAQWQALLGEPFHGDTRPSGPVRLPMPPIRGRDR